MFPCLQAVADGLQGMDDDVNFYCAAMMSMILGKVAME
jgi:hypothetical protein